MKRWLTVKLTTWLHNVVFSDLDNIEDNDTYEECRDAAIGLLTESGLECMSPDEMGTPVGGVAQSLLMIACKLSPELRARYAYPASWGQGSHIE